MIIVQGAEGGGHTGTVPTTLLVSQCVDLVRVPIVAAGGFRDGRGLVAALAFGAAGVAMGTRFLLTAESPVPKVTTDRYLAAAVDDVLVTKQIDGLPQRVVRNELVDQPRDGERRHARCCARSAPRSRSARSRARRSATCCARASRCARARSSRARRC